MTTVLGSNGNRIDYFYLNSSRALVHATIPPTLVIQNPQSGHTGEILGGEYIYDPVSLGDWLRTLTPSIHVFTVGSDSTLYYSQLEHFSNENVWQKLNQPTGIGLLSRPSVVVPDESTAIFSVFMKGFDNAIWFSSKRPDSSPPAPITSWNEPQSLGGSFIYGPSALAVGFGNVSVFAVDGNLHCQWMALVIDKNSGGQIDPITDWVDLGGQCFSSIRVVTTRIATMLFSTNKFGQLIRKVLIGTDGPWEIVPGSPALMYDPDIVVFYNDNDDANEEGDHSSRTDIFCVAIDGTLQHRHFSADQFSLEWGDDESPWDNFGGYWTGAPKTILYTVNNIGPYLDVLVRGTDRQIYHLEGGELVFEGPNTLIAVTEGDTSISQAG